MIYLAWFAVYLYSSKIYTHSGLFDSNFKALLITTAHMVLQFNSICSFRTFLFLVQRYLLQNCDLYSYKFNDFKYLYSY